MSAGDRVAVPTNGHRPALTDDAFDAPHHDATGSPEPGGESAEASDATHAAASSTSLPTISPGQVITGVGVLAALAVLLLGRRRGRD